MRYYIKLCETFGDEGIRDLYGEVGGCWGSKFSTARAAGSRYSVSGRPEPSLH